MSAFEAIRDMSEGDFGLLIDVVADAELTIGRDTLDDLILQGTQLDALETSALLDAVIGLATHGHISRTPINELVTRLSCAPRIARSDDSDKRLAERVERLLSCDVVRVHSKTLLIGSQHERIFANAQIVTDLRPLFKSDIEEEPEPEGVLLSHTLSVHFIGSDGTHDTFFVVLDDQDIETIGALIDRARLKAKSMRRIVKEFGLTYLRSEE